MLILETFASDLQYCKEYEIPCGTTQTFPVTLSTSSKIKWKTEKKSFHTFAKN